MIHRIFDPLWEDYLRPENQFFNKQPLLAHYTTIQVLEKIIAHEELWFANPLFMNDFEEVQFGLLNAGQLIFERREQVGAACKTPERAQIFEAAWSSCLEKFRNEHLPDTYIFCLSEHGKDDYDGALSMWRGYGANGNGAALVIDAAHLKAEAEWSPFICAQVQYGTVAARRSWLLQRFETFEHLLAKSSISNQDLPVAAAALFERIKFFALFTKHYGFAEEKEWRIVYMPERDEANRLNVLFHYWIGMRGVEPKLRYKIAPIKGVTAKDFSLAKLTERILLGPTTSSPLAKSSILRMLDVLGKAQFKSKVHASSIPFRP